jgi:hypothetical protein
MMGEPLVADRRPPGDSVLSDWSIRRTEHLVRRKTVPPPAIAPSERKRLKQMRSLPRPPSFFRGQILSLGQRFVLPRTNCLRCHGMFHVDTRYLYHVHFKVRGLLFFNNPRATEGFLRKRLTGLAGGIWLVLICLSPVNLGIAVSLHSPRNPVRCIP